MSNKKHKEIDHDESGSEDEQESGSERDSDFDSDGNFVGDKSSFLKPDLVNNNETVFGYAAVVTCFALFFNYYSLFEPRQVQLTCRNAKVPRMELQADFEGRNPEDCDFHGIKQLLRQLFLKTNVDLGALTQIIISQNYVGSVVKQCLDDPVEDDDEDDGSDGVFGVTTVINITKRKQEPAIQQVTALLNQLADDNADVRTKALIKKILSDESNHVGFVINERILNIPAAISVPLFSSLQSELDKAIKKNMPYTFQYLIWICKTYNTGDEASEILYANQEEKPLADEALASFDVDVSEQVDFSQWEYEGGAMTPGRKVLIFEGKKFNHLVRLLKEEVEGANPIV